MNHTVLVVDDNNEIQRLLLTVLKNLGVTNVFQARSLEEAQTMFAEHHHDIDGMIVDGSLGKGRETAGVMFVREMRKEGFTGPIVAASTDEDANLDMMLSGANEMISGNNKAEAAETLIFLLEK